MMKSFFLSFFLLTAVTVVAQKKDLQPFPFGVIDGLYSTELGEQRTVNIYLPPGYHPDSAARYPVIYLLDGSANEDYVHMAGLVDFMSTYALMPQSIVVGIANVNRKRDFTHPTSVPEDLEYVPKGGGSATFIAFLEKELLPYIDSNYRTNSDKMLIGQSLGGLLATEVFMRKTNLFNRYLIVSPSLWWSNNDLLKEFATFFQQHPDLTQQVCIAIGDEGKQMNGDCNKLVGYFRKGAPKTLKWNYNYMPHEDHATILHRAAYKAFEVFYKK